MEKFMLRIIKHTVFETSLVCPITKQFFGFLPRFLGARCPAITPLILPPSSAALLFGRFWFRLLGCCSVSSSEHAIFKLQKLKPYSTLWDLHVKIQFLYRLYAFLAKFIFDFASFVSKIFFSDSSKNAGPITHVVVKLCTGRVGGGGGAGDGVSSSRRASVQHPG